MRINGASVAQCIPSSRRLMGAPDVPVVSLYNRNSRNLGVYYHRVSDQAQRVNNVNGSVDTRDHALTFWFRRFNLLAMTEWLTFSGFLC
jgi:hypothetical protein